MQRRAAPANSPTDHIPKSAGHTSHHITLLSDGEGGGVSLLLRIGCFIETICLTGSLAAIHAAKKNEEELRHSEDSELPINIHLTVQSCESSAAVPEDNKCSGSIPDVTDLVEI